MNQLQGARKRSGYYTCVALVVSATVSGVLGSPQDLPKELPTFRIQSGFVIVPFQFERTGSAAAKLTENDIVLVEDGVPRPFTVFEPPVDRPAVELILLFDTTTWPMDAKWDLKAIYRFVEHWSDVESRGVLKSVHADIRVSIYHFDGVQLERLCQGVGSPNALSSSMRNVLAPIGKSELSPTQRRAFDLAFDLAPEGVREEYHAQPASSAGEILPMELPPGRRLAPAARSWVGCNHRGWPMEAAISVLKDSVLAARRGSPGLVLFSEGIGGTTTLPSDVANEANALGITAYPAVLNMGPKPATIYQNEHLTIAAPFFRIQEAFLELGKLTGGWGLPIPAPELDLGAAEVGKMLDAVKADCLRRATSRYSVGFALGTSDNAPSEHTLEVRLRARLNGKLTGGRRKVFY